MFLSPWKRRLGRWLRTGSLDSLREIDQPDGYLPESAGFLVNLVVNFCQLYLVRIWIDTPLPLCGSVTLLFIRLTQTNELLGEIPALNIG
jgi:hypothetical protein